MAKSDELVAYERDGRIVTLALDRPGKLNAFNDELVVALGEALRRFDADPEAYVAVICGRGRAFSSGADVRQRQLRPREELERLGGAPVGHSVGLAPHCGTHRLISPRPSDRSTVSVKALIET